MHVRNPHRPVTIDGDGGPGLLRPGDQAGQLCNIERQQSACDRLDESAVVARPQRNPPSCRVGDNHLIDATCEIEVELVVRLVVRRRNLDDNCCRWHPDLRRETTVEPPIWHPVVVCASEIERPSSNKAGCDRVRSQRDSQLIVEVAVRRVGGSCHVIRAFPHLVVQIDAERPATFDQRVQLGRSRPKNNGLHVDQATHVRRARPDGVGSSHAQIDGRPQHPVHDPSAGPQAEALGRRRRPAAATPRQLQESPNLRP